MAVSLQEFHCALCFHLAKRQSEQNATDLWKDVDQPQLSPPEGIQVPMKTVMTNEDCPHRSFKQDGIQTCQCGDCEECRA